MNAEFFDLYARPCSHEFDEFPWREVGTLMSVDGHLIAYLSRWCLHCGAQDQRQTEWMGDGHYWEKHTPDFWECVLCSDILEVSL